MQSEENWRKKRTSDGLTYHAVNPRLGIPTPILRTLAIIPALLHWDPNFLDTEPWVPSCPDVCGGGDTSAPAPSGGETGRKVH
eukprot:1344916-Amorphochlora_amoeboformis.AAC.1